jgi:putative hemolysin
VTAPFVYLLVFWSLAAVYFGALAMSIPDASRAELEAALRRRNRHRWLERIDRHYDDYALTAVVFWLLAVLMMILTLHRARPIEANEPTWRQPVEVLVYSVFWLLTIGLAIPRSVARYKGEALLAVSAPIIEICRVLASPVLRLGRGCDEVLRRLTGAPPAGEEQRVEEIEQEILDLMSEAQSTGVVNPDETRMVQSVMNLDERTVGEIMTPRTEVCGLDVSATYTQARETIVAAGHSRIPIYEESIDNILGVLYAKDLLRVDDPPSFSVRRLMRTVPFVPETKKLSELLHEFQSNRVHIAIVLDEYGGTAGLVTFEDIFEEVVGDIADEHEQPEPAAIHRLDERTAEVDARVRVDDLNSELGLNLPEGEAYDTVAGLVLSRFGRIPSLGEEVSCDNVHIEVIDSDDRRINRLRLRVLSEQPGRTSGSPAEE